MSDTPNWDEDLEQGAFTRFDPTPAEEPVPVENDTAAETEGLRFEPEQASAPAEDDASDTVFGETDDMVFPEPEETAPIIDDLTEVPAPGSEEASSQDENGFAGDAQAFQELYEGTSGETAEQAPPAASEEKAVRKGRPKRRRGEGLWGIPNFLVTIVWLAIVVLIGVTIGRMAWIAAAEVLAFGREDQPVTITIYEHDDIDSITKKLHDNHLIRYPGLFKLYAKFAVDDGEIHPGIWDLNTLYDYHALVRGMSPSSTRSVVTVTIPEGYSCRQIFNLLEVSKVCTVQDMEKYMTEGQLPEYWFVDQEMARDKYCLEGYLFPDTYEFYQNEKPENVVAKMLGNFNTRFDDTLRAQIATVNDKMNTLMKNSGKKADYIAAHQIGVKEILIIASMVERETATPTEGYTVASVIYNRLYRWGNNPEYLNIDAALVYALEGKNPLTAEDLRYDTPYNTYLYAGLTPGAIANPGLNSIRAALYPNDTNYYFYVLDPNTGEHHFSRTLEEHNAFRAKIG